ncbi:hypothetical protein RSAG8_08165, partial [Rhizoctonia solani AG-8 WAC10335]
MAHPTHFKDMGSLRSGHYMKSWLIAPTGYCNDRFTTNSAHPRTNPIQFVASNPTPPLGITRFMLYFSLSTWSSDSPPLLPRLYISSIGPPAHDLRPTFFLACICSVLRCLSLHCDALRRLCDSEPFESQL